MPIDRQSHLPGIERFSGPSAAFARADRPSDHAHVDGYLVGRCLELSTLFHKLHGIAYSIAADHRIVVDRQRENSKDSVGCSNSQALVGSFVNG